MRHRMYDGDQGDNGSGGGAGVSVRFTTFDFTGSPAANFIGSPSPAAPAPLGGPGGPQPASPFYLGHSASGQNGVTFDENCPVGNPGLGNVLTTFGGRIDTNPLTGAQTGTLTASQQGHRFLPVTSYFVPAPPGGWPITNVTGDSIPDMFASGLGYFFAAQTIYTPTSIVYQTPTAPQGCFIIPVGLTGYVAPQAGLTAQETFDTPDRVDYAAQRAGIAPQANSVQYSDTTAADPLTGELLGLLSHVTLSMLLV